MWGFFETIFKIGFGVAFGLFVHDTIWLISEHVHSSSLSAVASSWPSWTLIIVYPVTLFVALGVGVFIPLLVIAPFFLIWNKLMTGNFSTKVESAKAGRELVYFYIVWIYFFWAVTFKLGPIG
jgi:hypothetical protein